jgi:hypothetical protein
VNESAFFRLASTSEQRRAVARWIAARQGLPGCYGGMFAGFEMEIAGIELFTGEKITSASARHILGEEASRALRLLRVKDPPVQAALDKADEGMIRCLNTSQREGRSPGWFCCGKCSVGLWRNLLAGGLDRGEERLANGVKVLRRHRDGEGGWKRFPFWYTVLALIEMPGKAARDDLSQVAARLERAARGSAGPEPVRRRRQAVAELALSRL